MARDCASAAFAIGSTKTVRSAAASFSGLALREGAPRSSRVNSAMLYRTNDEVQPQTHIPWDNEFATEQIEELRATSASEMTQIDTKLEPARRIIGKNKHIIFKPAMNEGAKLEHQTAIVLLPGCFLEPIKYEKLALAIQEQSDHPLWVVVPKLFLNAAMPWTAQKAVEESIGALQSLGYPTDKKVFVGGHSLGGIFLPQVLEHLDRSNVAGNIQLGSFISREQRKMKNAAYRTMPTLTVVGDLDGLIRSSRIAEDIEHHVLRPIATGQDADETRLNHSAVLIPGMVSEQSGTSVYVHSSFELNLRSHLLR